MAKPKLWKVDAGNSTDGPVGFVLHNIAEPTKNLALQWAKDNLPEVVEERLEGNVTGAVLRVYLNHFALTLANVSEEE